MFGYLDGMELIPRYLGPLLSGTPSGQVGDYILEAKYLRAVQSGKVEMLFTEI